MLYTDASKYGGQEYSPKVTHQSWIENQLPWTTPCHMSVDYFVAVN